MSGCSQQQQQAIVAKVDEITRELGVEDEALSAARAEYLWFALYDMADDVVGLIEVAKQVSQRAIIGEIRELEKAGQKIEVEETQRRLEKTKEKPPPLSFERISTGPFRDYLLSYWPESALLPEQEEPLKKFIERVARIGQACVERGEVIPEAIAFIDERHAEDNYAGLYEQVFGKKPEG